MRVVLPPFVVVYGMVVYGNLGALKGGVAWVPCFAKRCFAGEKQSELRRRRPIIEKNF